MLFKILRGNEANLPTTLTDGYCYFLKDKHYFYVDYIDDSNTLVRSKLSAEFADKLRYINGGTMVEIAPEEIALKSELDAKADTNHIHDDFNLTRSGFVPAPMVLGGESMRVFLRADGSWETPTDTVYDDTEVRNLINQKADANTVYTEAEVDELLSDKSDIGHKHDSDYDAKGAADTALASANAYADTAASNAANKVKDDLLNGAGSAYDTLKELGDLIDENVTAIDALDTVAASKADKATTLSGYGITDAYTKSEMDVKLDDIQDDLDTHGHEIADVTGLQTALDSKAASSHGTHVTYSTTAPVMDGTAAVGTAETVARSDHKHPTDTSRAAKTDFDNHVGNKSNPHGVTLSQLSVTATAAEINILDGATVTTTELNYLDGVASNVQDQLDGKSDDGHTHDDRYFTESEINTKINALNYAGSSTNGGSATSAVRLDDSAGSNTQPVYFEGGKPKATTYQLNKTVPANAEFTDTVYDDTAVVNSINANSANINTLTTNLTNEIARAKAAESTNATEITNTKTDLNSEITRAKAAESTNATQITNTKNTLSALIGEDTGKTVRKIANEELAAQLVPADAQESLDTLAEIAAWIQDHPNDAAAMNEEIDALEAKVDTGSQTVTAYVTAAIAALNIGDYATAANLATLAARVTTLESASHSHSNKTELDKITSGDKAKWDAKQDALTFDSIPTANSTNPVTSGGIKTALDGKADSSHGTHVTYSTATPVMNGTASVGSASTVSRSDHVHPVDTSRAAKTDFDSHVDNKSNPHSVTAAQVGAISTTEKGVASGVATLGSDGKVPTSQLPTMGGHYAGTSAPSDTNLLWINTNNNTINYYTGSAWKAIGAVFG